MVKIKKNLEEIIMPYSNMGCIPSCLVKAICCETQSGGSKLAPDMDGILAYLCKDRADLPERVTESVCKDAYDEGFRFGMQAGMATVRHLHGVSFQAACQVERVWRNGDHTILLFADGEKERVTYHHEPGTAYDAEKALMAGMLKHLMGSRYIHALKEFGRYAPKGARHPGCGDCSICGCRACDDSYDEPVVPGPVYCDEDDQAEVDGAGLPPVACDPEEQDEVLAGSRPPVECEPDDDLDELFAHMAVEPGFGPEVFPA